MLKLLTYILQYLPVLNNSNDSFSTHLIDCTDQTHIPVIHYMENIVLLLLYSVLWAAYVLCM